MMIVITGLLFLARDVFSFDFLRPHIDVGPVPWAPNRSESNFAAIKSSAMLRRLQPSG